MKRLLPLLALALVGCNEAHLAAPDAVERAATAPTVPERTAVGNDRSLQPARDFAVSDADTDDLILLAFYNAEERVLSVHSRDEAVSCGTAMKIKPLADRLVVERIESSRMPPDGTVYTRVYTSVTPTMLDDFLADVCSFLDTTTPAARGRVFWAYTYGSYKQSSNATTPYTLNITGRLPDANGGGVHLRFVRHYLVPPGGDPADVRRLVARGPSLKRIGPSME